MYQKTFQHNTQKFEIKFNLYFFIHFLPCQNFVFLVKKKTLYFKNTSTLYRHFASKT